MQTQRHRLLFSSLSPRNWRISTDPEGSRRDTQCCNKYSVDVTYSLNNILFSVAVGIKVKLSMRCIWEHAIYFTLLIMNDSLFVIAIK
jgi:hypothetical protein